MKEEKTKMGSPKIYQTLIRQKLAEQQRRKLADKKNKKIDLQVVQEKLFKKYITIIEVPDSVLKAKHKKPVYGQLS